MEPKKGKFWFYIKDQQQHGPIGTFELQKLFEQGVLSGDTFVWTKGSQGWHQAKTEDLFKKNINKFPPHATDQALAEKLEMITFPRGRPVVRFIARMFDLSLFTLFFITFVAIFSPDVIIHTSKLSLFVLNLLLWVFIEPIILCIFGNTVGRAMMNTKIKNQNGESIHFRTAFKRSLFVITAGMGFGVPVLHFICNLFSLLDLRKNGMSKWDEKSGTIVLYGKVELPRLIFASLVPITLFISGMTL